MSCSTSFLECWAKAPQDKLMAARKKTIFFMGLFEVIRFEGRFSEQASADAGYAIVTHAPSVKTSF
jgi:hypothetical protein